LAAADRGHAELQHTITPIATAQRHRRVPADRRQPEARVPPATSTNTSARASIRASDCQAPEVILAVEPRAIAMT
jgi:hypothetical protein